MTTNQTPYSQAIQEYLDSCFAPDNKPDYNLRVNINFSVPQDLQFIDMGAEHINIYCYPNGRTYAVNSSHSEYMITHLVDSLEAALHLVKLVQNPILLPIY